jgi:acyl-CoA thioesterase-1
MKIIRLIILFFCFTDVVSVGLGQLNNNLTNRVEIRYAVIGDSYSIGEGAFPQDAWPTRLTKHLATNGLQIALVTNPSTTGWTTRQAIDLELPIWKAARPDFATLQIGVNDLVQGVDIKIFRQRFIYLVDEMLEILPDKRRLLIITIPDFSVTPTGKLYGNSRDISQSIIRFNQVIKQEASRHELKVVDIFSLSQAMGSDFTLIAPDGLHPSAKEYAQWEKLIFPTAQALLVQ